MTILMKRSRWIGATVAVFVSGILGAAACNGDDSGVTPQYHVDSGPPDSTVNDGSNAGDVMVLSICTNYPNGYADAQNFASHILAAVQADCRISANFTMLMPGDMQHLTECFQKQVGFFMGCQDPATGKAVAYDKDGKGNTCRNMNEAHNGLNLRTADFNAFIDDSIASLKNDNVSKNDITSLVGGIFEGYLGAIVPDQKLLGDEHCTCLNGSYDGGEAGSCYAYDASTDSDASDSEASADDTGVDTGGGNDAAQDTGGGGG